MTINDSQHGILSGAGHAVATTSTDGMVSAADKTRLNTLSVDMFDDEVFVGTVTTTDATTTVIYTYAMPNASIVDFWVEILGYSSGVLASEFYRMATYMRNNGSTLTQIGSTQTIVSDNETNAATTMSFSTSGTNVTIRVNGIAATTVNWWIRGQVMKTSWA